MKNLIKRLPVVAASVVLAGGAVLGAVGTASATPQNAGHDRGTHQERDDGYDVHGARYADDHRTWRHDDRRDDDAWGGYQDVRYRWDGHRLHQLVEGRWVDVTPSRHGEVDRWYVDQVLAFER